MGARARHAAQSHEDGLYEPRPAHDVVFVSGPRATVRAVASRARFRSQSNRVPPPPGFAVNGSSVLPAARDCHNHPAADHQAREPPSPALLGERRRAPDLER